MKIDLGEFNPNEFFEKLPENVIKNIGEAIKAGSATLKEAADAVPVLPEYLRRVLRAHGYSEKPSPAVKAAPPPPPPPLPSKEEFTELYGRLSVKQISKQLGISEIRLAKLRREYGIPKLGEAERFRRLNGISREVLYDRLVRHGRGMGETAGELGVAQHTIFSAVGAYGINLKDREKYQNNDRWLPCPNCGKKFYKNFKAQFTCSEECSSKLYNKTYTEKQRIRRCQSYPEAKCLECGAPFQPLVPRPPKFCSDICREKHWTKKHTRTCLKCGTPFIRRNGSQLYCSDACKGLPERGEHTCTYCGGTYLGIKHCTCGSESCKKAHRKEKHAAWMGIPENKRRKRVTGNLWKQMQRKVNGRLFQLRQDVKKLRAKLLYEHPKGYIAEVIKRMDHFGDHVCCWCGEKQDENLTLEHIVPLSRGGDNRLRNLLGACRKCNESKWYYEWKAWFRSQPFYSPEREIEIEALADPELLYETEEAEQAA